jgi:lipopolysaccharide transport system permease protein
MALPASQPGDSRLELPADTALFMHTAFSDIRASLQRWRVALYIAWSDTRARYRRSVLGPFWLTLGTAVGVGGLGLLWSELLRIDRATFIPSLTAGLIVWQMLAACVTEGSGVFTRQGNIIRNLQLPYFLHPMQLVLRHLVNFAHNMLVFVLIAVLLSVPVTWNTLLFLPGLALVTLNLLWIVLLFGMLGARFRDIEYALTALIPLLFFLSPVLFRPENLPFSAWFIWLNPLSHLIEVVRAPLLGSTPPAFVYITVGSMLIIGWALTLALFNGRRNRIAFWV